jgi:hypothetical protein
MRLLELEDNGNNLRLTEDFVGDNIPQYAILSHTWGKDSEEVTFKDLVDTTIYTNKADRKNKVLIRKSKLPTGNLYS